jgi:hypothetical protein
MMDPGELDLLGASRFAPRMLMDGRRVIAMDGKSVRGARTREAAAPPLVAAFDHDSTQTAESIAAQSAPTTSWPSKPTRNPCIRHAKDSPQTHPAPPAKRPATVAECTRRQDHHSISLDSVRDCRVSSTGLTRTFKTVSSALPSLASDDYAIFIGPCHRILERYRQGHRTETR